MRPEAEARQRVSAAIYTWLSHHEMSQAELTRIAGVDTGTLGEFLSTKRWPGTATRGKVERALGWPAGTISGIAEGQAPPPLDDPVSEDTDTGGSLLYRRPEGLTDDEWDRLRNDAREYIEWQISRAARER